MEVERKKIEKISEFKYFDYVNKNRENQGQIKNLKRKANIIMRKLRVN